GPVREDGEKVLLDASGLVTVHAIQDGNDDYEAAPRVTQSVAVRERQFLQFEAPPGAEFGLPPIQLQVAASSGLPVAISHLSGPAKLDGTTVTPTGAGTIELKLVQGGDEQFSPVESLVNFMVKKGRQTIDFGSLADKFLDDPPFAIEA